MCEPQFSVTPESREECRSGVELGLLSDTSSDLWKCLSSLETSSQGGGTTLHGNVTNGQTVRD